MRATAVVILFLSGGCSDRQHADLEEPLALYRENKLEEALPLFIQHISNYPEDTKAHSWLAETYRRLGKK